jgi:hypothetical protein
VLRNGRIVAAALAGAVAIGVFVTAVVPGAGGRSSQTSVTLQLAPRGLGSVIANPPGLDSDNQPVSECTRNYAQHACEWRYARGTTVALVARPDTAAGRRLARWSTDDCPGTGTCAVVLDDDLTSIVALLTPLRLAVRLSNAQAGSVRVDPPGADCHGALQDPAPNLCREFPARTRVTLTVQPTAPHTFRAWSPSCAPVTADSCAITVLDEATWVGVSFDDNNLPVLPTTIKVQFRLRNQGDGNGRVTASNLDCGSRCSARFDYGASLTLTAVAGRGSVFDGWKEQACAATKTRCTLPVGPITRMFARFARQPRAPASLKVTKRTRTSLTISWSASKGPRIARYRVYLNGVTKTRTQKRAYRLRGLRCGRRYRVAVAALDGHGHQSPKRSKAARTRRCARR